MPEFISILRWIRDIVYPKLLETNENVKIVADNMEEVKALNTSIEDGVLPFEKLTTTTETVDSLLTLNASNGDTVIVKDLNRGGTFIYDAAKAVESNGGTNFSGWVRQYNGSVNVKWFGAKGDGTTDDATAIQDAIDSFTTSGEIVFGAGIYLINRGIVSHYPILLKGETIGDITSNTNGSGKSTPLIRWGGLSSLEYMFTIKPVNIGDVIFGGGSDGIAWDGSSIALGAVHFDNTKYSLFDGQVRAVVYTGVGVSSTSGSPTNFSQQNYIRRLDFTYGASSATEHANALTVSGNGSTVPSTQQKVGVISGLVHSGYGMHISETDNCKVDFITVATLGTGGAVRLVNSGFGPSNSNTFGKVTGKINSDASLYGNYFEHYGSEGGGIVGDGMWDAEIEDYTTGKRYKSHTYSLREKIELRSGDFINGGNMVVEKAGAVWDTLGFPPSIDSSVSSIIPPRYNLDSGVITAVEVFMVRNTAYTNVFNFTLKVSTGGVGEYLPVITPEVTVTNNVSSPHPYIIHKHKFIFPSSMPFSKDDTIFIQLVRNGTSGIDVNAGSIMLLGARILYTSNGPTSIGSGTYSIPEW